MDFQSAMETFAEAWVAANTKTSPGPAQNQALALCKSTPASSRETNPPKPPAAAATAAATAAAAVLANSSTPQDLTSSSAMANAAFDFTKSTPGKHLPVHCVVESTTSIDENRRSEKTTETDSFVIIPGSTPFQDLMTVALQRLGYPSGALSAATGCILLKNWHPLPVEKVPACPGLTVADVLSELSNVVTLRIRLYRPRPTMMADIKDKLLKLYLAQSPELLLSTGCPLDDITWSHVCRGTSPDRDISEESKRKFDNWLAAQVSRNRQISQKAAPEDHPLCHGQKTRMRTSFDPELELPKLQRWFAENQHPSRQQIQQYVKELNGLDSRRGRKPLDVNNVVYWFKNARAAQKRAEVRSVNSAMVCHLGANGYNTPSQNALNVDEYSKSSYGNEPSAEEPSSDMEDDQALSPLSLTKHEDRPVSPKDLDHNLAGGVSQSAIKEEPEDAKEQTDDTEAEACESDTPGRLSPPEAPMRPSQAFPLVPNSMFSHSIMYMSQYLPGLPGAASGSTLTTADDRRKRNRTFIDPVTEVPRLEQWFSHNTHPSHSLILKYTEELNCMAYRQKFPRLEPKNVQFWFKNRRAKCKRLKMSMFENQPAQYHHERE